MNCRFCFRRHFPYQDNNPGRAGWQEICHYIAEDPSIHEVILSGGDPLLASDKVLAELIQNLDAIPHLSTLRFHTRIPVVFPERIDEQLLQVLHASRLQKVVVIHCNHPQELNAEVHRVCQALADVGCYLLNQSVFLAKINDDPVILATLSKKLFAYGILPYYLHVLDKVEGAAHFDTSWVQVQNVYNSLQSLLPGYLVPRLVREEPGVANKTLLI